jgi:hypothetical protein
MKGWHMVNGKMTYVVPRTADGSPIVNKTFGKGFVTRRERAVTRYQEGRLK